MNVLSAQTYAARPSAAPPPEVMLYSDIDDTFVGWTEFNQRADEVAMARTRHVLTDNAERMVSGLSTSRGLTEVQRLASMMKGFPIAFVGMNNGQQLFVNRDAEPTDTWLASLRQEDADPSWTAEVAARTSGWNVGHVLDTLRTALADRGFVPAPAMAPPLETLVNFTSKGSMVSFYPDQPSFAVRSTDGPLNESHQAFAKELAADVQSRMQQSGVPMDPRVFPYEGEQYICLLEPRGLDKTALLHHTLTRYPSVHAVITAGDNTNDTMLYPDTYGEIPNYRVVAGDRKPVEDKMQGKARVERCAYGDIGPAIARQLEKIQAS